MADEANGAATGSVIDTIIAGSASHGGLSSLDLFLQADIVVKAVMLILVLASVWSWAILFEKLIRFRKLRRMSAKFEGEFWSGRSLEELHERIGQTPADPMSSVFAAAMREWEHSSGRVGASARDSLQQRIERVMILTMNRELDKLERYLPFLASVGSLAPFIGLFGTVWGIMNSFASIAATNQTSLAVVAPGIAEALFATALGLVAAIPATWAYNKLSSDLGRYSGKLESFAGEFGAIISRQLDERS